MGEEGEILVHAFAEAEAGIEDDAGGGDAGGDRGFGAGAEGAQDEGDDFAGCERRQGGPFRWTATGVHQDGAGGEIGAGRGHGRVPEMAADVVDDFGAGLDGETGGGGVVGVDGKDGVGAGFEDGAEGRENAGLFFFREDGRGVGAGGFAAKIEYVRAFVQHLQGVGDRSIQCEEIAAVGEGVGCEVEDAHHEGARAEREGAGAEMPLEVGAGGRTERGGEHWKWGLTRV